MLKGQADRLGAKSEPLLLPLLEEHLLLTCMGCVPSPLASSPPMNNLSP